MNIESFAIGLIVGAKNSGGEQPTSSPWTKIAEKDFTVSTTSTTATDVGTISCGSAVWTKDKMVYVRVRDKAGKRNGYFYGFDAFFINFNKANNVATSLGIGSSARALCRVTNEGAWSYSASTYGFYPDTISEDGNIAMQSRYNGNHGAIDGTYHVEVYTLEWPDNVSPFA